MAARSRGSLLLALTFLLGLPGFAEAAPNVVLMMADDLGWGDVGFNGNDVIHTPHLDRMARDGLRFTRFYAAAPVCSPTRGSCLTGRHPYRYGIFGANSGHVKQGEFTLAEALETKGYVCGHFGKWHLGVFTTTEKDSNRGGPRGRDHFAIPTQHGFDAFFSTEAKVPTFDPLLKPKVNARRTWFDPVESADEAVPYGTAYWTHTGDPNVAERVTDPLRGDDSKLIVDRAVDFVRDAAQRERAFFAVVWFHAPHLPVVAGPEHTARYAKHGKYAQHYFGCVTALDEQVGRLRKVLDETGVADDTLLWFCSDNGPEGRAGKAPGSAGPLRGRKRSLYEGGVRVPGVAVWPQVIPAGRTTDVPACTSDYLPTVLAAAGFDDHPPVTPLDGVNLLPLLRGDEYERPRPIAFESRGQVSLVGNRFKLIRSGKSKDFELYDLQHDPGERQDVAGEHPEVVERMRTTLEKWRASCAESRTGADYGDGHR